MSNPSWRTRAELQIGVAAARVLKHRAAVRAVADDPAVDAERAVARISLKMPSGPPIEPPGIGSGHGVRVLYPRIARSYEKSTMLCLGNAVHRRPLYAVIPAGKDPVGGARSTPIPRP